MPAKRLNDRPIFGSMEWQNSFFPVSGDHECGSDYVGGRIAINEGQKLHLEGIKVAFFSIEQDQPSGANQVRSALYRMRNTEGFTAFADLGDYLLKEHWGEEQIKEVGFIISELLELGIAAIVYSSVEGLAARAIEAGHQFSKKPYALTEVNASIASSSTYGSFESEDWLTEIISQKDSCLFHYTLVGYQGYYVGHDQLDYLHDLGYEYIRLGQMKPAISEVEPYVRTGNTLLMNAKAIQSAFLGGLHSSPNGINGEEACAIMRYAGANAKLDAAFLESVADGMNPTAAELWAQAVWYFVEGFFLRFDEDPINDENHFTRFTSTFEERKTNIHFLKSKRTDKWWMYLPVNHDKHQRVKYLVPCSYTDYVTASNGEIPERWLNAVTRLGAENME